MIVRSAFNCSTCDQAHTVRIGMGQETRHLHRFPCCHCGEEMVVALCVDYEKVAHWVEPIENAEWIDELPGAPIVNLDANFIVPTGQLDKDFAFPRFAQFKKRMEVAEENGSFVNVSAEDIGSRKLNERPLRRPDFEEEWKLLKTTWALHRRGRTHLVADRLKAASATYYASEPITSIQDWLWRFMLFFSQPAFESPFQSAFGRIRPLAQSEEFKRYSEHYNKTAFLRGERYLELFKSYFDDYDQFSQVHFDVVRGIDIIDDGFVSSTNFAKVKMFYGNTFELLSSHVDILAFFSNMIAARAFDQFQSLSLKEYLRLDKPSRFRPIAMVPEFDALCVERDNQLRNASHHGGTRFDPKTQIISYQAGKGGQGQTHQISFAKYLVRCDRIFMQMIALYRLEIMMCQVAFGLKWPI